MSPTMPKPTKPVPADLQLQGHFSQTFNNAGQLINIYDPHYAHFGRLASRPNNVQDARFGQLDPAQRNQPRVVVLVAKILF